MAVCSTIVFSSAKRARLDLVAHALDKKRGAVEIQIEISVRRRDDTCNAGNRADSSGKILSDGARRLAKGSCERKGDGDRQIAERPRRWNLDGKRRHVCDAELLPDRFDDRFVYVSLNLRIMYGLRVDAERPL